MVFGLAFTNLLGVTDTLLHLFHVFPCFWTLQVSFSKFSHASLNINFDIYVVISYQSCNLWFIVTFCQAY